MQIKDSRYHKVWDVTEKNGFTKLNLGDSKKNKDGEYDNWTWYDVTLVGNAKNVTVNKGDTITIVSGQFNLRKYEGKYYNDIVVFELEVTKRAEENGNSQNESTEGFRVDEDFDPNLPF